MKNRILMGLLCVILTSTVNAQLRFRDMPFEKALSFAKESNKMVFLDIQTVWCKPCREMDKNVFTDRSVGSFFNRNYVSLKIDAEKGEGIDIAKKYGAKAYPTLVFLNSEGEFVSKKVGGIGVEALLQFGKVAMSSDANELAAKIERYESGKMKSSELLNYLEELKAVGLGTDSAIDDYVKSLRKKELLTEETYNTIRTYTRDFDTYAFQQLVENYETFKNIVSDKHRFDRFISGNALFKAYYPKKEKTPDYVYKQLKENNITYWPGVKETHVLVSEYLKNPSDEEMFIDRAENLIAKYPIMTTNLLNEVIKYSLRSERLDKYALDVLENHAKKRPLEAARLFGSYALISGMHRKEEKALGLYKIAAKYAPDNKRYEESIVYYNNMLGYTNPKNHGELVKNYTLQDANGNDVDLDSFKGKYVLIDFWASWCGPCKGEVPFLQQAHDTFDKDKVAVVGITIDKNDNDWKKDLEKYPKPWTQLTANYSDLPKDYNVNAIPRIMILDTEGKIVGDQLRGVGMINRLNLLLSSNE